MNINLSLIASINVIYTGVTKMRLNEIKNLGKDFDLSEGVIPCHILMTLEQIIRDGKVTNNVQNFIVAAMIEMFKNGGPTRWPRDLNAYEMSTSAELIEAVKQFTPEDAVGISVWLLNELQRTANFETNPCAYANPQLDPVAWLRYVLKKQ